MSQIEIVVIINSLPNSFRKTSTADAAYICLILVFENLNSFVRNKVSLKNCYFLSFVIPFTSRFVKCLHCFHTQSFQSVLLLQIMVSLTRSGQLKFSFYQEMSQRPCQCPVSNFNSPFLFAVLYASVCIQISFLVKVKSLIFLQNTLNNFSKCISLAYCILSVDIKLVFFLLLFISFSTSLVVCSQPPLKTSLRNV